MPLEDVRYVAVSPNGELIATGSHDGGGVQVWAVRDGSRVAEMPMEESVGVQFSPDGKWLLTTKSPCRLWRVGVWQNEKPMEIGGQGLCFSRAERLLVVKEPDQVLRLTERQRRGNHGQQRSDDLPSNLDFAIDVVLPYNAWSGQVTATANVKVSGVTVTTKNIIVGLLNALGVENIPQMIANEING